MECTKIIHLLSLSHIMEYPIIIHLLSLSHIMEYPKIIHLFSLSHIMEYPKIIHLLSLSLTLYVRFIFLIIFYLFFSFYFFLSFPPRRDIFCINVSDISLNIKFLRYMSQWMHSCYKFSKS